MERADQTSQIRIRRIDANGIAQPSAVVSGASGARPGGFARMKISGNQAFIAWTISGAPQVKVATVDLAAKF